MLLACLRHPSIAYTHAVIGGVTAGVAGMCVGVLTPNLFGRRYLGGILGVIAALNVVGSAIGPVVPGVAFDSLGRYTEGIIGLSVLPLIAGVLSLFIRQPSCRRPDDTDAQRSFAETRSLCGKRSTSSPISARARSSS